MGKKEELHNLVVGAEEASDGVSALGVAADGLSTRAETHSSTVGEMVAHIAELGEREGVCRETVQGMLDQITDLEYRLQRDTDSGEGEEPVLPGQLKEVLPGIVDAALSSGSGGLGGMDSILARVGDTLAGAAETVGVHSRLESHASRVAMAMCPDRSTISVDAPCYAFTREQFRVEVTLRLVSRDGVCVLAGHPVLASLTGTCTLTSPESGSKATDAKSESSSADLSLCPARPSAQAGDTLCRASLIRTTPGQARLKVSVDVGGITLQDSLSLYLVNDHFAVTQKDIRLSEDGRAATNTGPNDGVFRSALGARKIRLGGDGSTTFSIHLRHIATGVIRVGVATPTCPLQDAWRSPDAWGYHGFNGRLYWNGKRRDYGPKFGEGDTVTVVVHHRSRKVRFLKNGESLGVAFGKLPDEVVPFVEFGHSEDSVEFGAQTQ
ncbi:hypothetical protein KIPB_000686 [Kipferlia bialata]|uniref:B30.2/SPRY domain-containing protein n=1 Tax=Kipferlia bialata TaxID=797122 RepID=A0A9K3CPF7_9EUKA|nr:hypothetical protein KIPB_000686 [Kipferlia bialata]|eukprot:g686.t1